MIPACCSAQRRPQYDCAHDRLLPLALTLCCPLGAISCSADPDLRADDWEENYDRVQKMTASGEHGQGAEQSSRSGPIRPNAHYRRTQEHDGLRDLARLAGTGEEYDEVLALLSEAKNNIEASADNYYAYASRVHDLVGFAPDFPRDKARTLLPDTVALIDQSLAKYGRTENLIRVKGMLLREQAEIEPDPARQSALQAASQKTFEELDRLEKK